MVAAHGTLSHFRVQSVDLTDRTDALLSIDTSGAVFLGCPMDPEAAARARAGGALVFPPVPDLPFDPYRGLVYSPDELFASLDEGYEATPDARAYAWFQRTKADGDIFASMLRSIHDDAVSDALDELLAGARVVGVMGGHAMARGTEEYAGAARLGRELARAGLTVATGGGPGAMEAANLGAYAAPFDDGMLTEALRTPRQGPVVHALDHRLGARRLRGPRALARRRGPRSASPPGSTATSRRTRSPRTSPSTSPTPPARTACWPAAPPAWCSCRAPPAPYRRSSTTRRPTTTSRGASRRRWCWWTVRTGRNAAGLAAAAVPRPGAVDGVPHRPG